MSRVALLSLLISTIANAEPPCEANEVKYPNSAGLCTPKIMATFLTCATTLGQGQISVTTSTTQQGKRISITASGGGKGLLASGGGSASIDITPDSNINDVTRIFAPDVLQRCEQVTKMSFSPKIENLPTASKTAPTPQTRPATARAQKAPPEPACPGGLTWDSTLKACQKTFLIPATAGWTSTYVLKKGQTARIRASGAWDVIGSTGPEGNGVIATRNSFVMKGVPEGCLVVLDGAQKTQGFSFKGQEIFIGAEGEISFQANDESDPSGKSKHGGFKDNKGQLTVTLIIE